MFTNCGDGGYPETRKRASQVGCNSFRSEYRPVASTSLPDSNLLLSAMLVYHMCVQRINLEYMPFVMSKKAAKKGFNPVYASTIYRRCRAKVCLQAKADQQLRSLRISWGRVAG